MCLPLFWGHKMVTLELEEAPKPNPQPAVAYPWHLHAAAPAPAPAKEDIPYPWHLHAAAPAPAPANQGSKDTDIPYPYHLHAPHWHAVPVPLVYAAAPAPAPAPAPAQPQTYMSQGHPFGYALFGPEPVKSKSWKRQQKKMNQNKKDPRTEYSYVYPGQARRPEYHDENGRLHMNWIGRTEKEIEDDNHHTAQHRANANSMAPKDPKPSDLFQVYERSGGHTYANYATIKELYSGDWGRDPRTGEVVFWQSAVESEPDTEDE